MTGAIAPGPVRPDQATPTFSEQIAAMNTYVDGKMKRYNLLWAVNGGAFAIARLLPQFSAPGGSPPTADQGAVLGGLTLPTLAIGASLFTVLMCADIWMYGQMMRRDYFGNGRVFGKPGRFVLVAIGLLIVGAWMLAAFG
jgi:hypothetical protein